MSEASETREELERISAKFRDVAARLVDRIGVLYSADIAEAVRESLLTAESIGYQRGTLEALEKGR